MKAILKKLRKDIGKTKGQAMLSLVAIIITVWGVSTVYYGYWMSERDFRVNFDQTQPAQLQLSVDTSQLGFIKSMTKLPEIEAVERRESFMGRVKDEDGDWMPILLFAVEDFARLSVNTFTLEGRDWPSQREIAIERKSAVFLGEGKQVEVQLPGKEIQAFPLASYTHDPRLPSARMDRIVYGYLTLSTYEELGLDHSQANYLLRVKAAAPSLRDLEALEGKIQDRAVTVNSTVAIKILPLDEHPHQNVVDAVSVLQLGLGVILSILGVTLLSLILLLWMLPQVREVALMKAIGAPTQAIRKAYLLLLVLAGTVGISFGLPLGYISGSFFSRFIAFTQNFDPITAPLAWPMHLPIALACLSIPLLIGWRPIAKAITSSSIQGLRNVFSGLPKRGVYAVQWLLPSAQIRYSLNTLLRNGPRLLLSLSLLVLGLSLFFVGVNLQYSLNRDTEAYFAASSYQLSFRANDTSADLQAAILAVPNVAKVWPIQGEQLYVAADAKNKSKAISLQRVPADYNIDPAYWIAGNAKRHCRDCVWINQGMAHELGDPQVGQTYNVKDSKGQQRKVELVGTSKELAVGPAMYAYAREEQTLPTRTLWVQLQEQEAARSNQTQAAIEALLGESLLGSSNSAVRLEMLSAHLQPTFLIIKAIGGLTIAMGLLGLGLLININIQERQKEIGILKALGTSDRKISHLLLQEIICLNGLGIILAIPIAYFISLEMGKLLGGTLLHIAIPFHADGLSMSITVLLLLGFQWMIWIPYLRAKIRRSSVELIRV